MSSCLGCLEDFVGGVTGSLCLVCDPDIGGVEGRDAAAKHGAALLAAPAPVPTSRRSLSEPLGSYWTIVPDQRGDMISVRRSHRLTRSRAIVSVYCFVLSLYYFVLSLYDFKMANRGPGHDDLRTSRCAVKQPVKQ